MPRRTERVLRLRGKAVSGIGDGAKYVLIYRNIIVKKLGIDPFPGTFNIDIGEEIYDKLSRFPVILIPPPGNGYRPVLAYRAKLVYGDMTVNGYIVIPCASVHRGNIIEFIAPINIRKELGVKNGEYIYIIIY